MGWLEAQSRGDEQVTEFQPVSLLPINNEGGLLNHQIKEAIDNYLGYFNAGKWDQLAEMISENVTVNWNGSLKSGREALMAELQARLTGIPITWSTYRVTGVAAVLSTEVLTVRPCRVRSAGTGGSRRW